MNEIKIKKKMRYKLANNNEEISILPFHKPTVYQKKERTSTRIRITKKHQKDIPLKYKNGTKAIFWFE